MEKKTATFIKSMKRPGWALASLYECNPPLDGCRYILASSIALGDIKECRLFRTDEFGAATLWEKFSGQQNIETLDGSHELAFKSMGYEVVR